MRALIISLMIAAPAWAEPAKKLDVTSSAFDNNQPIPAEYTCDGSGKSPPLSWSKVPPGTQSIALLVEDPDAPRGTFTHWLVTGFPPTATSLDKGVATLPDGATAEKNDKGQMGYAAPCPPSGRHRYMFRVFALDTQLGLGLNRASFLRAIRGHVVAAGQLVGTYQKQRP